MAAATPIPVDLSEWLFAGLYSGSGVKLAKCKTVDLEVPADSEFVLEGAITPGEVLPDGPFDLHTYSTATGDRNCRFLPSHGSFKLQSRDYLH